LGGDYLPRFRGFELTSEQRWPVIQSHIDVERDMALAAQRAAQTGRNVSEAGEGLRDMTAPHLDFLPGMTVPEQSARRSPVPIQLDVSSGVLAMFDRGVDPSLFRGFSNRPDHPWERMVRRDGLDYN
jgi:hypothetical protein